jgi:beta-galactosidase
LTKLDLRKLRAGWGDLRIDGLIEGKPVISKSLSGRGVDAKFVLLPDDHELHADGADATRVVMRVTDEFGAVRTYANDPISLTLEGPGRLIGDNPFSLIGGTGAVWIRAGEDPGTLRLKARHPRLGTQTVELRLIAAPKERV